MALRGLNTLRTLRILRKPMPEPPKIEIRETETTTISRQLNGDRQKAPKYKLVKQSWFLKSISAANKTWIFKRKMAVVS